MKTKTVYQTVYHGCLFTSDLGIPKVLKLLDSVFGQMPSLGRDLRPWAPLSRKNISQPIGFLEFLDKPGNGVGLMVAQSSPYLFRKRGVYYFSRRVPKDLMDHYEGFKIVFSLRTKSFKAAKVKAASLASQLEEDWLTIRWRSKDTPLRRFLKDQVAEARVASSAPLMTEAGVIYLNAKAAKRPITFSNAVDRSINNLVEVVGDKPIDTYSRQDVNLFRDACFDRGLSRGSVTRMFGSLRAIINFTARELGLSEISVFSGVYFGDQEDGPETKRPTIPLNV